MSRCKNLCNLLLLIFLNHLITLIVFFHSFALNLLTNSVFSWSNICLFIRPISFLDGFMSLVVGWLVKFSLWSFKFAKQANILDLIEINGTGNSFITLKDHKDNFTNRPTTRLINPSKNEIGWINKHIWDQIKKELVGKLSENE